MRGRTGEIAQIKRLSRRRVEQLWQAYRQTGIVLALKKPSRPSKAPVGPRDATAENTIDVLKQAIDKYGGSHDALADGR